MSYLSGTLFYPLGYPLIHKGDCLGYLLNCYISITDFKIGYMTLWRQSFHQKSNNKDWMDPEGRGNCICIGICVYEALPMKLTSDCEKRLELLWKTQK